jgi:hypothetical protein
MKTVIREQQIHPFVTSSVYKECLQQSSCCRIFAGTQFMRGILSYHFYMFVTLLNIWVYINIKIKLLSF